MKLSLVKSYDQMFHYFFSPLSTILILSLQVRRIFIETFTFLKNFFKQFNSFVVPPINYLVSGWEDFLFYINNIFLLYFIGVIYNPVKREKINFWKVWNFLIKMLPLGKNTEWGQAMVIYPLGQGHFTKNGKIPFLS